jgi:hypothetical protein
MITQSNLNIGQIYVFIFSMNKILDINFIDNQKELFHAVHSILQAHSNRYHSSGVATELVRRGGFTDEFIATNARIKHATNARIKGATKLVRRCGCTVSPLYSTGNKTEI